MDDLFLQLQTALAGEYSLERELGRGGMGVVYLAREVRLAREVAIKVLPPSLAADAAMRDQFFREARTAARLSHPNIVPIHRVDEAGGFVYFVMAYVAGETLAQRIRTRGPLAPHHAAQVLREVAWALTYAHANGIIHRDVKPENILLESGTDRALVTDFGIAGAMDADARAIDGHITGTAHYASPEQIAGQPLDAASDLYSLGVTGFYALTGRVPFDAPTSREVVAMHLNARPPAVASFAPAVPPKLALIIERCLAKRPEHRYPTAAAFAEAIQLAAEPPREIPAPLRVWLHRTNESGRVQLVAAAYLAAVAGPIATATGSTLLGALVATFAVVGIGILPSVLRTRRVIGAGYTIEDLRAAIREHWARKREEVAVEFAPQTSGARRVTWTIFGASSAAAVALSALQLTTSRFYIAIPILIGVSATFAVGSVVASISAWSRRKEMVKAGSRQIKFYSGKWGERFVRLCSIGLKRKATASSLPQLTEVALGRATDALYDALPKAMRKELKALPLVVRRLEEDATKLRADVDRLDASIGQLDGDARASVSSAIVASSHESGVRAERDRLRTDLRRVREIASDRLAATVAALENIRLDLLRLQLGDGHVASVTASLESARAVANDVKTFADAVAEVDRALADRTSGDLDPSAAAT